MFFCLFNVVVKSNCDCKDTLFPLIYNTFTVKLLLSQKIHFPVWKMDDSI